METTLKEDEKVCVQCTHKSSKMYLVQDVLVPLNNNVQAIPNDAFRRS